MQTSNYQIQLLSQNQAMKEYTINHALNKVSWLLNRAVIDFICELPEQKSEGDMYIIAASTQTFVDASKKVKKIAIILGTKESVGSWICVRA